MKRMPMRERLPTALCLALLSAVAVRADQPPPATPRLMVWTRVEDLVGNHDSGSRLDLWPDASGNGNDLKAAGEKRPALKLGLDGGPDGGDAAERWSVGFSGDGCFFTLPLVGEWRGVTIFAAGKHLARPGLFETAPARDGCLRHHGWVQLCGAKASIDHPFPAIRGSDGLHVVSLSAGLDARGAMVVSTRADGQPQGRGIDEASLYGILFQKGRLGCDNPGFTGEIAEFLLYDGVLSDGQIQLVERYLMVKHGLAVAKGHAPALPPGLGRTDTPRAAPKKGAARWSDMPRIPTAMSWLGNTFSGKDAWVQSGISGITVLPDGTVAATSIWDERHKEIGFYKDGQPVGPVTKGGASGLTFDDDFFYVGHSGMGKPFAGIRRYRREGSFVGAEAPWTELGATKWILFDTAQPWQEVRGLALLGNELFVTAAGAVEVRTYDKRTGVMTRALPIAAAGAISAAPDGTLWVGADGDVVQLAADGQATGRKITGIRAGALAVDSRGSLLVGAGTPRHQIVRYDIGGAEPVETSTIGTLGGVYAAPRPGLLGDDRLWNIMGVGADADGNVYVQCNGQLMRAYSPDGTLRWQLECSVFCVAAAFDPAGDGTDLIGKFNRYRQVPGEPPGRDWQWQAVTYDGSRFPELAGGLGPCVAVRRLNNGRIYRYTWVDALAAHVQEPEREIFQPCSLYVREKGITQRPANAPAEGRFVWTDRNGNGLIEAEECVPPPADAPKGRQSFSFFVDDAGGIWEPQDRWGVRHLPLQGFAESGAPIYDLAAEVWYPKPLEFSVVLRTWYFPATDTMYLSGYTWDHPATGKEYVWGCCGRELIRYDDWTKPTRALRSRMPFPEYSYDVKSAAIAHDANRAFAVDKENVIFVYDTESGNFLGFIEPDKALVGDVGWMDIDSGLNVWQQRDGTLVLVAEESWSQRILIYRLAPGLQKESLR